MLLSHISQLFDTVFSKKEFKHLLPFQIHIVSLMLNERRYKIMKENEILI